MYQELKRHKNIDVPVAVISDETSNFKINGLIKDISWTRGSSIIQLFVLQSGMAFEKTYGPESFDILLNESEVVLWLPGQASQPMLNRISAALGQQSVVMKNQSGSIDSSDYYVGNYGFSEDGKPLLDADLIRRSDKGILFTRGSRAALVDTPPYAAIDDVRDVAQINPRFKKPFKKPISVWLNGNRPPSLGLSWRVIKRRFKRKDEQPQQKKLRLERYAVLARVLSQLASIWWFFALLYVAFFTDVPLRILIMLDGVLR